MTKPPLYFELSIIDHGISNSLHRYELWAHTIRTLPHAARELHLHEDQLSTLLTKLSEWITK